METKGSWKSGSYPRCVRDDCRQPTSVYHMSKRESKGLWEVSNVGPVSIMDLVQNTEVSALYFSCIFFFFGKDIQVDEHLHLEDWIWKGN